LRQFFDTPTVAGLAAIIEQGRHQPIVTQAPDLVPLPREARRLQQAQPR
jgi:hypothetical protein